MKKKIYIHVGPPKTGSSVLQYWLHKNSDWLSENGIYYPKHSFDMNSVSSGHRAIFLEKRPDTTRTHFNHSSFKSLLVEFEETDRNILLISSEFFFYQIPEFLKYSDSYDLFFIAYIRADFELVESLYNQSVKRNGQTRPLSLFSKLPRSYLDDLIDLVRSYPGKNFILRAYGGDEVFDGNIVTDFLSTLGLKKSVTHDGQNEKINTSYSFECLEFKRWLNKFHLGEMDHLIDQCLQGYPSSERKYTLLPANIYESYQKQSLVKIEMLNKLCPIANVNALVKYIEGKHRPGYIHQELYRDHFLKVISYFKEKDNELLCRLVEHIKVQDKCAEDQEWLALIDVQYTSKREEKKQSLLAKLFQFIRK